MSATSRLKQLLFIVAALALVSLGLVAAFSPASPARADDTTCVPTQDTLSPWANEGAPFTNHDDATPPTDPDGTDESSTTNLVRYVLVSSDKHVTQEAVEGTPGTPSQWWNFSPDNQQGPFTGPPAFPTDERGTWQGPHTEGGPSQELTGTFQQGAGNAPWFHREAGTEGTPGQEEVSHTDYTWQKQIRTFTEGVDCPDPGPDCEQDPTAEGCPPVDNGKKVVVCKYVGTPGGTFSHIIIVSENSLNNTPYVAPPDGDSWTDAQGQTTEGSVAIRYANEGEQAHDVDPAECGGEEPEVCPEGTDNAGEEIPAGQTEEEFCDDEVDPGPETCPEGTDKAGQEIPQGQTEEEFCDEEDPEVCPEDTDKAGEEIPADKDAEEFCDEDDDEDVCPEGSDHAGEEVPAGGVEECDDDDVDPGPDCTDDPTQKKCDEDNPPVVVPDDGSTSNNGPTVRGASATAPTAAAGTTVAGTPAARVPTAVNAGLAPQELAGDGGTMGLLGIAAALLGAALVGLTVRPRRRIGAASHART